MKIRPKSLYTSTADENAEPKNEPAQEENVKRDTVKGEQGWPYQVGTTLDKLDFEDRKWLLFQLVLCKPSFLDEVELGFPTTLVPDSEDMTADSSRENSNGKEREGSVGDRSHGKTQGTGEHHLLPIVVPSSDWLLTYCQVDAIPSETRDDFLLNLFLMSYPHALILLEFQASLESGKEIQEAYDTHGHILQGQARKQWIKRFKQANRSRRAVAQAAMGEEYGGFRYWEELGRDREGVWDVALSEIGSWLTRDLPDQLEAIPIPNPNQSESHTSVPGQEISNEGDGFEHEPFPYSREVSIAQQHVEMMGFIVETKILSLIRKITRLDSASESWTGRYRYKALTISDLVKLSVLVARSPIPLRRLLVRMVETISAEIVVLLGELEGAEYEWVRVDENLGWDIDCVQHGLDEVELGYLWDGVVSTWSKA